MAGDRLTGRPPAPAARSLTAFVSAPAVASTLVAAGLVLLAVIVRILISHRMTAPWIMSDELIYGDLAESFSKHREMLFRDHARPFQSIYPILVSPAWAADSMTSTYSIAKGLNAVLMSLAAIPFYLWARRLLSQAYALAALVLFLVLPAFVYTSLIMTENAALPAILLALFTMAWMLERPTLLRQVLTLAAIGIACAARLQALVLFVALPTAIVVKAFLDARALAPDRMRNHMLTSLRRFVWVLGAIVLAGVAYLLFKLAQGSSLAGILGAYQGTESGYSLKNVARWIVFHAAELPYSVALIPISAFIVLFGLAVRRSARTTEAERAFLAVALGSSVLMVVQVASFASQFSQRVEERNMLYLQPLFLIALLLWVAKGLPRPAVLTGAAVLVPAALLVSLPLESLLNVSITSDTFAFVPLLRLAGVLDGGMYDVRILLALGTAGTALAFLWLPRRFAALLLPVLVGVFLALTSYSVFGSARVQSEAARAAPGVADPNWIDESVGSDASVVMVNDQGLDGNPHTLWQTEFWNRSVDPVLNVAPPSDVLGRTATIDPATGRISAVEPDVAREAESADYAVAPATLDLAGRVLARPGRLVLYRPDQPLRLARSITGLYTDGWSADRVSLIQYATPDDGPARLRARVERPDLPGADVGPARVTLALGALRRSVVVGEGETKTITVPTPGPPFNATLRVTPTFSPAGLGLSTDARQLGVRTSFTVLPR
jgi:hypothetical protein